MQRGTALAAFDPAQADWEKHRSTTALAAPRLVSSSPSPKLKEKMILIEALRERLLTGVSPNPLERDQRQQVQFLVAYMLDFHHREEKSAWWEYYRLCDLDDDDLFDEPDAITGLVHI